MLFKIAGLNPWLFLLLLIPFVNIVVAIWVALKVGAAFGKSGVWSFFLLVVFSVIGFLQYLARCELAARLWATSSHSVVSEG